MGTIKPGPRACGCLGNPSTRIFRSVSGGQRMRARWVIIANPIAGRGRAERGASLAAESLDRAGMRAEVHSTRGAGHAAELAVRAAADGVDFLVVSGGDGTVAEVLQAVVDAGIPLGLLPSGTGNDLARALKLPRQPEAAAAAMLAGRPTPVDVALVNGRPYATVSSLGLDAEVSQVVNRQRLALPGAAAYIVAALKCLRRLSAVSVRLTGDFGRFEGDVLLVAGANTSSYGGGMQIAPQADPSDGLLDLCVVRAVSRRRVVSVLPRVFWGGHVRHPAVTVLRSLRVVVEVLDGAPRPVWADGEPATHTPAVLEIEPGGLQVILPAEPPAAQAH